MWTLKFETQGHTTENTGLTFETPELAYAAVEAFSDRAIEFEQEGLVHDPIPDDPKDVKAWLDKHGWPDCFTPVIYHDDGRIMADLGEGEFTIYTEE